LSPVVRLRFNNGYATSGNEHHGQRDMKNCKESFRSLYI